jgi:hypothetical protein
MQAVQGCIAARATLQFLVAQKSGKTYAFYSDFHKFASVLSKPKAIKSGKVYLTDQA